MKRKSRTILAVLLVTLLALSFPALAKEDLSVQGYVKLPDSIEHIKADVSLSDIETIKTLESISNRSIDDYGIKRNVLVDRLDDKNILIEDDKELVLIYKVQYTVEDEATTRSPITTGYRVDSEYYSYNNMVINLSARIDYNHDNGYTDPSGAEPFKLTKSTFSFSAGSAYYNYRLGVEQIEKDVRQYGPEYPSGNDLALSYGSTKTYAGWVFSDTNVVYHSPTNYTLMKDGISGGYMYADGFFDVVMYGLTPPYSSSLVNTVTRSTSYGAPH